jgi:hypothetical protein
MQDATFVNDAPASWLILAQNQARLGNQLSEVRGMDDVSSAPTPLSSPSGAQTCVVEDRCTQGITITSASASHQLPISNMWQHEDEMIGTVSQPAVRIPCHDLYRGLGEERFAMCSHVIPSQDTRLPERNTRLGEDVEGEYSANPQLFWQVGKMLRSSQGTGKD